MEHHLSDPLFASLIVDWQRKLASGKKINKIETFNQIEQLSSEDLKRAAVTWCQQNCILDAPIDPKYPLVCESIDAARSRMNRGMGRYFSSVLDFWQQKQNPDFDWLTAENDTRRNLHGAFWCDVGLGKSHSGRLAVIKFIKAAKQQGTPHRVLWLVPHHALGQESYDWLTKAGISVAIWRGREAENPLDVDAATGNYFSMCRDTQAVADATIVGADIEEVVCGNLNGAHCPFLATCAYMAQKEDCKNADVVIAAHNMLYHPMGGKVLKDIGVVVVDEGFWKAGLYGARDIKLASFVADVTKFPVLRSEKDGGGIDQSETDFLVDACKRLHAGLVGLASGAFVGRGSCIGVTSAEAVRAAKAEWRRKVDVDMFPGMQKNDRDIAKAKALNNAALARRGALWHIVAGLMREDENGQPDPEKGMGGRIQYVSNPAASGSEEVLLVRSRHDVADRLIALPTLLLDATYQQEIAELFFPKVSLVVPHVRATTPNMQITQVMAGFGMSTLMGKRDTAGNYAALNQTLRNKQKDLRDFVALKTLGEQTGLVVTYQNLEKNFHGLPGVGTAHFNAITGLDKYGSVDHVFVIGRVLPNPNSIWHQAVTLFGEAIPLEGFARNREGVLLDDGTGLGILTSGFAHPALQAVKWACCDAEVIQALGRGRGVNRTAQNPLQVWLLADVVVPFPTTPLDWDEVRPNIWDELVLAGGATTNSADAFALYPNKFSSANYAKTALHRVSFSYKGTSRRMILCETKIPIRMYEYQWKQSRAKPVEAHVPVGGEADFKARLEATRPGVGLDWTDITPKPAPKPEVIIDLCQPDPTSAPETALHRVSFSYKGTSRRMILCETKIPIRMYDTPIPSETERAADPTNEVANGTEMTDTAPEESSLAERLARQRRRRNGI